ncbi:MAG: ABC transporter permease, partial [Anaerolineaceae bacterium]|nr:ABC transporter permease [Anaerolineaceae bacterium]
MNIGQLVIEAFESLISNKLRSSLTMLGIVIGVAAVIAMLAIGQGAQSSITGQINGLGSNLIYVSPGAQGIKNPRPLTMADANALADPAQAPSVELVAPVVSGRVEASAGGEASNVSTNGVTPVYADLRSLTVSEGEFITDSYLSGQAAVAVIGVDTADNLFGRTENVVGETIRLNGQVFRVIGLLTKKGGSGFGSQDD